MKGTERDNDEDGIAILDSSDTEICGTPSSPRRGPEADPIPLYQDNRQSDGYRTKNVPVLDNAVTTCVGWTGVMEYVGDGGIFDPLRSNRSESNTYAVPDPAGQWWCRGGTVHLAGLATELWARHDGVGHDGELLAD